MAQQQAAAQDKAILQKIVACADQYDVGPLQPLRDLIAEARAALANQQGSGGQAQPK